MSAIASDVYASLGLTAAADAGKKKSDTLGQADFLRLMTEQLQHQDPLNPMQNSEFLGQLAQFSTVQGIQGLQSTLESVTASLGSDQVLRGASLIGRSVLVPSAKLALGASGGAAGAVAAPGAGTVTFEISDGNGQSVRRIAVAAAQSGEVAFEWDGLDAAGTRLPAGRYGVTATYVDASGASKALDTYVEAPVQSVTVGSDGLYLDLAGLGTTTLDNVLRVR
ncbi:flagellar hook capping FlgD N-terminal domain-containing protein [Vulcaniibacterium tengchongense]|uniref:Basal-body rod modification protein FlgD n=1 Tax=Vulcaniibacterium tengchongense TaxID=1273429 RepID=A0A3N4VGQ6_9GAMM|nr:flagellar hook capping FlgD N-terminal domain-containing protein [Vulcaniibacterium tengchongense]RPE80883.1 flagellar basal-body rod modification protein FlgD [Vulcaniibacterium tengchongense]